MGDQPTTRMLAEEKERWPVLKEILADALEREPGDERETFLEHACAGHSGLFSAAQRFLAGRVEAFEVFAEQGAPGLHETVEDLTGHRLGAYRVQHELGRGGMGAVYLAERDDGQFAKRVAIKVLKPGPDSEEILRRFRMEREILARLEHSNITRLLDAGTTEAGLPYFIMEYVDGVPITAFARQRALATDERVALFLKICGAVEYAHREGVLHRDIKPSNLLIGADGEPKLLDFGIARVAHASGDESTVTLPWRQRLTPQYASPEQRAGLPVDARSDIYSMGAVLLDLLTSPASDSADAASTPLPAGLGRIVSRAMAVDPACRYDCVADLRHDLERYLSPPNERFGWTHSRKLLVAGVTAMLAFAGFWWAFSRPHPGRGPAASESVAVLPFRSLGTEPSDVSLGLGLADAVTTRLSGIKQLSVLPATSALLYKGDANDTVSAGRALQVDAVLSGTVQRAGEKIRVTVQLLDVESQRTVWAETFDQEFTTIFEIQDVISERVARSFPGRLTAAEERHLQKRATTNPEAYDAFTMALYFWNKRTHAGLDRALEYLERATTSDPQFARAYALAADCHFLKGFLNFGPAAEEFAQSRRAAERALALDPSIAEAHLAMSTIQILDGDRARALESLGKALSSNPNLAVAHQRYAWELCAEGDLATAETEMRRAVALDPLSSTNNAALGAVLVFTREYPSALASCLRAVELEPANASALLNLGWVYQLSGRDEDAIETYRRMAACDANREGDALALQAAVLFGAGRREEAEALIPQVQKFVAKERIDPYYLAVLHVAQGDLDSVFELIKKTNLRVDSETMLRFDPLLDRLREDRRFMAALGPAETTHLSPQ